MSELVSTMLSAIADVVLEFLIRGIGYLIVRIFTSKVAFDSTRVLLVGILFWLSLLAVFLSRYL